MNTLSSYESQAMVCSVPVIQRTDRYADPLELIEALLVEACRIADDVGLDFAAIRIEEALIITRNQAGRSRPATRPN